MHYKPNFDLVNFVAEMLLGAVYFFLHIFSNGKCQNHELLLQCQWLHAFSIELYKVRIIISLPDVRVGVRSAFHLCQ